MARLTQVCPGDCSKCELLANGTVDFTACILDQIFQKQQCILTNQAEIKNQITELHALISAKPVKPTFIGGAVIEEDIENA